MLSEKEKENIRKEAQQILVKFGKELDKVKVVRNEGKGKSSSNGLRKEGEGDVCDKGFKERMFRNAPKHDSECLIAEKKTW